jgi:uncharacterized protein (TIGR00375 family)
MTLPTMARMAKVKGIDLLATGDFTHPLWFKELESQLEETSEGIYKVKDGGEAEGMARYILGTEISCIYSQGDKGRRIHLIVFAPNLETVKKINEKMRQAGCNLLSDGRPIIGLSAIQLCELLFGIDERILVVPAHAWTPWFSLYGSKSGFDSIDECFGAFAKRIWAVETGLSSDPLMNWRIAELDSRTIVSFSDAHSPAKLGRELTVFTKKQEIRSKSQGEFSFGDFAGALKQDGEWGIAATVEFYPEEGKYHYTGHRNCRVVQSPQQTKKLGTTCPVCGRPLTIGVMHRVEQLAGREIGEKELAITTSKEGVRMLRWQNRPAYMMLVPLQEILAEVQGMGVASKGVQSEYERLITLVGSELQVLTKTSLEELERVSGPRLREAVEKVRKGDIFIDPGYDGVFGVVKIWGEKEKQAAQPQQESLF